MWTYTFCRTQKLDINLHGRWYNSCNLSFPSVNNTRASCYLAAKWKSISTQDPAILNSAEIYANLVTVIFVT